MERRAPTPSPPRRRLLGALLATGTGLAPLGGCTTWPAPTVPMHVQHIGARCGTGAAPMRCVLLPGVGSRGEDFVTEGFVADLQQAAPRCDITLADAHLGYFVEGQLVQRLREDVVRAPGTGARPWLVGISLGGMAALAYAMRHGDEIAGVLAIAPYLGRRELLRDILEAGGPRAWSRLPPEPHDRWEAYEALEDDLWRWLAQPGRGADTPGPTVHLACGRDDRFADAHRQFEALLPAGHTDTVPGGHDWPPWRALWQRWLQRGLLGAEATAACPAPARGAAA